MINTISSAVLTLSECRVTTCRQTVMSVLAVLFLASGCKPAPPPSAEQTTPPQKAGERQPAETEFRSFFATLLPPTARLTEVKTDSPVRMPNTSPADNVWMFNVKITITPTEDLLSLPSTEDAQAVNDVVTELNALIDWRDRYVNSPYAKACGGLAIKVPVPVVPQLLVVTQRKDHPLPSTYGKVSAEWQVDHWMFRNMDLTLPSTGQPRSAFSGSTMVKGSAEADAILKGEHDAITHTREQIEAIRSRYAEQVAKGSKLGTTYQGRVTFRQDVQPCELRFLDPPVGGDAHFAAIEVRLPNEKPPCVFTYNAKLTTELPLPVPTSPPTSAPANLYAVSGFDNPNQVQGYNVKVSLVRSVGKMDERTLPGQILVGNRHDMGEQVLLLLEGHIEGTISYYNAPGIKLSAQQINP